MSSSSAKFINQGAILQEFIVDGKNIVLGFNTAAEYRDNSPHFGETIGRIANRLKDAKINSLNNVEVTLAPNDPPNCLHGGVKGWGVQDFQGPTSETRNGKETIIYTHVSPDGDENFPGKVEIEVAYASYDKVEDGVSKAVLEIEYAAKLVDGADETVINMTNHSYFNIGASTTIDGTQCVFPTNLHLPLDATGIPSTTTPSAYTSITPNTPFTLGVTEPSVDDCFILNTDTDTIPIDTRPLPLQVCAAFHHPDTKLHLVVSSTEPAFQFYTGNGINVEARPDGSPKRGARAGFCVEPSRYVNAANVPDWKKMTLVKKGKTYGSKIVFTAWKGGDVAACPLK